jgi:putative ABC transport system permease protein
MFSDIRARINSRAIGLRMARRDVSRNRLQSILVIAVITMPVALAAFAFTNQQSGHLTPSESVEFNLGQTQAQVQVNAEPSANNFQYPNQLSVVYLDRGPNGGSYNPTVNNPNNLVDFRKVLTGYKWLSETRTSQTFKTKGGQADLPLIAVDAANANLRGKYFDFSGLGPKGKTEVLLNQAAAARLDAGIGSTITIISLGIEAKVVGTIEDASVARGVPEIFAKPSLLGQSSIASSTFYAVGSKVISWDRITKLNKQGISVLSRAVLLNPPSDVEVPLIAAGGIGNGSSGVNALALIIVAPLVLMPIVILAGSAFSFAARRQARSIAVMSSLGARKSTLRFITLAGGLWLGLLGGALGAIIGATLSWIFSPGLSDGSKLNYPGLHLPFGALLAVIAGGAAIGGIVSAIPARSAAKVDVLATLRGTRRDPQLRKRSGIISLSLVIIGAVGLVICVPIWAWRDHQISIKAMDWRSADRAQTLVTYLAIASSFIAIIGLLVGAAWVLRFTRFAFGRIGPSAKYATNDLVHNRRRFTSVIASVIATSFVAATVLGIYYSAMKPYADSYLPTSEANQIRIETDYSEKKLQSEAALNAYLSKRSQELKRQMLSASGVAETNSSGLVNIHQTFGQLGYKYYNTGELILGAEGQVPYAHLNFDYLCPWFDSNPDFKRLNAAYQSGNWRLAKEITSSPKYKKCSLLAQATSTFIIADAKALRLLLAGRIDSAAEAALNAGKAVVYNQGFLTDGKLQLDWYASGIDQLVLGNKILPEPKYDKPIDANGNLITFGKPSRVERIDAVTSSADNSMLAIVIPPATADRLGIDYHPLAAIVNYKMALTVDQVDALRQMIPGGINLDQGVGFNLEGYAWIITLLAGLFILASTLIALMLSQLEARPDQSTLWAIGASRFFRSKALALQALALTMTGTVFGSTVGFALVLVFSARLQFLLQLPVPQVLLLVVGIPALCALALLIFTPKRFKLRARLSLD